MIIDTQQIQKILPQAYPFVMIDSVTDYEKGKSLTAIKNLTANEWPITGYLGGQQQFPENLLIEAAAQAALILYHVTKVKEGETPLFFLRKVNAEFKHPVYVGDQLALNVQAGKIMKTAGYAEVSVDVDKKNVAEIGVFFGIGDRKNKKTPPFGR
ncbi:MAG: hypothetical protein KAR05_11855, partial [Candidatus Omnitrophica bacterium]|nr:hypothetical protein [Candidatus Omnitrophota bacterium]